jgi:beta-galactosidase GanA
MFDYLGVLIWVILGLALLAPAQAVHAAPPHLEKQGDATHLIVEGKPMLVLAGELGNSSASSVAYMAPHWPRLKQMHLNTVLAPVYWELIEPQQGRFRWDSVDALIESARANDLKLVLLWFGTWKNSMSTYVPAWVKRDPARFPRAQLPNGRSVEILSALSSATRDADSRAFVALLTHIKTLDAERNTVLMIQVENEIGMLPVARDYSPQANRLFHEPVPQAMIRKLSAAAPDSLLRKLWETQGARKTGDWTALFGEGDAAAEVFTAWHYARFVESVVLAGKAAYPLPMYVNTALNRPKKTPGEYPSGGPLPHLFDVWKVGAPSLDFLAPDIYFPNFVEIASRYARPDNALFIPEANNADKAEVAANAFYAFGQLEAFGFAPFAIESVDDRQSNALARAYAVLEQLSPVILANEGMAGFRPQVLYDGTVNDQPVTEVLGRYRFTVSFIDTQAPEAEQDLGSHGGLIIRVGPEEYLVAGQGMIVTFEPVSEPSTPACGGAERISATPCRASNGPARSAGIDSDWEGTFDAAGTWVPGRALNGDQTHQGRHLRLAPGQFQIQRVRLYQYP